jgi:hypothetical protein
MTCIYRTRGLETRKDLYCSLPSGQRRARMKEERIISHKGRKAVSMVAEKFHADIKLV